MCYVSNDTNVYLSYQTIHLSSLIPLATLSYYSWWSSSVLSESYCSYCISPKNHVGWRIRTLVVNLNLPLCSLTSCVDAELVAFTPGASSIPQVDWCCCVICTACGRFQLDFWIDGCSLVPLGFLKSFCRLLVLLWVGASPLGSIQLDYDDSFLSSAVQSFNVLLPQCHNWLQVESSQYGQVASFLQSSYFCTLLLLLLEVLKRSYFPSYQYIQCVDVGALASTHSYRRLRALPMLPCRVTPNESALYSHRVSSLIHALMACLYQRL